MEKEEPKVVDNKSFEVSLIGFADELHDGKKQDVKSKGVVAILIPTAEYIPGIFVSSYEQARTGIRNLGFEVHLGITDMCPLDDARNRLLEQALKFPDVDYVLWLDTDMMINPAQAAELIGFLDRNRQFDCTTGLYFKRGGDHQPLAFLTLVGNPTRDDNFMTFYHWMPKSAQPVRVDGAGMGCFAIRMKSLRDKVIPNMKPRDQFFLFEKGDGYSEDLHFCALLKKCQMNIILLPYVEVPHYGGLVKGSDFSLHEEASKLKKTIKIKTDSAFEPPPAEKEGIVDAIDKS